MAYASQSPLFGDLKTTERTLNPPFGQPNYLGQILAFDDPTFGGAQFIYGFGPSADTVGQTISSITFSGTTATVTTGSAHGLLPGAEVNLVGQTPTIYSGVFTVVTVPSTTTFTITLSGTPSGNATVVGTYTATAIQRGQFLEWEYTTVNGIRYRRFKTWAGTANTGKPLAVAHVSVWANQYFYAQVQGLVLVQTTGTPALGNSVYYSANGAVKPTANAGLQVLGAEYAGTINETILFPNYNNDASTTPASISVASGPTRALMYINRPFAQGAIT
jgi:hypothetical protein